MRTGNILYLNVFILICSFLDNLKNLRNRASGSEDFQCISGHVAIQKCEKEKEPVHGDDAHSMSPVDPLQRAPSDLSDASTTYSVSSNMTLTPQPVEVSFATGLSLFTCIPGCPRNISSTILILRLLQKMTKNSRSRVFSLVQWKSYALFKRLLKMPYQRELHFYAHKIVKSQIPYLGRKWKSFNMKTVTNIYLECRLTLCDEYLYHVQVDAFAPKPKEKVESKEEVTGIPIDMKMDDAKRFEAQMKELVKFWHIVEYGFDVAKVGRTTSNIQQDEELEEVEDEEEFNWATCYDDFLDSEGFWDVDENE